MRASSINTTYIHQCTHATSHMHTRMQTCTHVCWQIMHLHATIHATILHACGQYTCMQTPWGRRAIVEEDSQATEALNRSPSKSPCGCFGTISFPAKAGNTFYNKSLVSRLSVGGRNQLISIVGKNSTSIFATEHSQG